jgi:hypothetical protein
MFEGLCNSGPLVMVLIDAFTALDVQRGTPVRNFCALKKKRAMKCSLDFFGNLGIRI